MEIPRKYHHGNSSRNFSRFSANSPQVHLGIPKEVPRTFLQDLSDILAGVSGEFLQELFGISSRKSSGIHPDFLF